MAESKKSRSPSIKAMNKLEKPVIVNFFRTPETNPKVATRGVLK